MSARTYIPIEGGPSPSDLPVESALIPRVPEPAIPPRPQPMTSLIAAATRITSKNLTRGRGRRASAEGWQEDAWEMYDLVGELRFVTNLLANQMSKARFYVGTISDNPEDAPVPSDDPVLKDALEAIGDGPSGLTQLVKRLGVNMQIPGDAWLVGIPKDLLPDADDNVYVERTADGQVRLDDLVWQAMSVTEVSFEDKNVVLTLGDDAKADIVKAPVDDVWLIRTWNPHPRRFWQADSATRSALPVLRELVGLTMHISAQIDSRLAGAGMLVIPESVIRAAKRLAGIPEDDPDRDPFTDSLIEAMMKPISDRSNASAVVPLVVAIPDEATGLVQHITFVGTLDAEAKGMRDDSIRRYALSADAPPELLLGLGDMNHWGAWLVQEDTVRAHLEPPLALVCDAITTQYIRVLMDELGTYTPEQIDNTVVWYDVEHLIVRADANANADKAHSAGIISDEAYRKALGFGDDDAPAAGIELPPAVQMALDLVSRSPGLASTPGLPILVQQLEAILAGKPEDAPPIPVAAAPAPEEDTPEEDRPVAGPPSADDVALVAAGSSILEAQADLVGAR